MDLDFVGTIEDDEEVVVQDESSDSDDDVCTHVTDIQMSLVAYNHQWLEHKIYVFTLGNQSCKEKEVI